ncbi:hypothetical protein N9A04_00300 [Rickettsiales bacterium]|nr:hypothetical protein [Rickettsiales bacterium]
MIHKKTSKQVEEITSFMGDITNGIGILGKDAKNSFSDNFSLIKKNQNRAGVQNFRLGKEAMRENDIKSAIFRFYIASIFSPKSPMPNIYLFKAYMLAQKQIKAVMYLRKALSLRPKMKKYIQKMVKSYSISNPEIIKIIRKKEIDVSKQKKRSEYINKKLQGIKKIFTGIANNGIKFVEFVKSLSQKVTKKGQKSDHEGQIAKTTLYRKMNDDEVTQSRPK